MGEGGKEKVLARGNAGRNEKIENKIFILATHFSCDFVACRMVVCPSPDMMRFVGVSRNQLLLTGQT